MRVEDFAWLPVALPVSATRVEAHDRALADLIGAEAIGGDRADVEIGTPAQLAGRAPTAIVPVLEQPSTSSAPVRAAVRIRRHLRVRRLAAAAARDLRGRGYAAVRTIEWEPGHRVDPDPASATRAERMPLGLVVVAGGETPGPTIVETLTVPGSELRSMKSGAVVAVGADVVLRVAVGKAGETLEHAHAVLAQVRTSLRDLVPEPNGRGVAGLGHWTRETRLQGEVGPLDDGLLQQCVDVLARLHAAGGDDPASLTPSARAVAASAPRDERELLRLAAKLDGELVAVPRGFAHGDFWAGNLLSAGGRLTGIVDWDAGGAGRLPLLDLLHLLSAPSGPRTATPEPGVAFEEVWRQLDDAAAITDYCQRIGIERHPALLRRLAVAFWLERAAWVADRSVGGADSRWAERNVEGVLRFLANNQPL